MISSMHINKCINELWIQWNLLITDIQGTGQNGRYEQVTAIDR